MGIELTWEEENGQELARLGDPQSMMQSWLPLETALEFSCLRFIDQYGDTVFNRLQIPALLQEMKSCKSSALNPAVAEHLDQAIALVSRAEDCIHTYIRFIGD